MEFSREKISFGFFTEVGRLFSFDMLVMREFRKFLSIKQIYKYLDEEFHKGES